MARGACQATVHGITQSWTQLHAHVHGALDRETGDKGVPALPLPLLLQRLSLHKILYKGIYISFTHNWASLVTQMVKKKKKNTCNAGDPGLIPGLGRSPGEGNGNPSSILAWKIPWMEEPGRLQAMGSQRVGHNRVTSC